MGGILLFLRFGLSTCRLGYRLYNKYVILNCLNCKLATTFHEVQNAGKTARCNIGVDVVIANGPTLEIGDSIAATQLRIHPRINIMFIVC
jgi:hypothetical protein